MYKMLANPRFTCHFFIQKLLQIQSISLFAKTFSKFFSIQISNWKVPAIKNTLGFLTSIIASRKFTRSRDRFFSYYVQSIEGESNSKNFAILVAHILSKLLEP